MRANLNKRVVAYLIDLIIVIVLICLVGLVYNPDTSVLNEKMSEVTLSYADNDISFEEYMGETSSLYKQIDMTNIFLNIINVLIIIGYFVVFPYFNEGQTVGKRIQGIRVRNKANQPLSLFSLFIRNLIINGLVYMIAVIICALLVPDNLYFMVITILGIIQIFLCLISAIMVLYRKDRKGLHDLIACTWVARD